MSDSSTGGYIQPTSHLEGRDEIEDIIHDAIAGITGLPGNMVRPKWPKEEVSFPDAGVDWCSFGIPEEGDDTIPGHRHVSDGEGHNVVAVHEPFLVHTSFYGNNSRPFARKLRMGLAVVQNLETLYQNEIAFIDTGPMIHVPEIVGQVWNDRWDIHLRFRRRVAATYNVLNLKKIVTSVQDASGREVHNR